MIGVIVLLVLAAIVVILVPLYVDLEMDARYWKTKYMKQNKAFVEKEKLIMQLRGEVKALTWMTNMIQDLEAMDEMMVAMENEQTPDWYRRALADKLSEIKNLNQLLELAEESNTLLVGKFNELQKEYDAIAGKINKLAEQYKELQAEKPETMQSGVISAEQAFRAGAEVKGIYKQDDDQ